MEEWKWVGIGLTIISVLKAVEWAVKTFIKGVGLAKKMKWNIDKKRAFEDFPDDVKALLAARFPEYRLPKKSDYDEIRKHNPFVDQPSLFAKGDFYGDGSVAFAITLIHKDGIRGKVVVCQVKDFQIGIREIENKILFWRNFFIYNAKPATYTSIWLNPISRLQLVRDAFSIGNYESSEIIVYWDKSKSEFKEFAISD